MKTGFFRRILCFSVVLSLLTLAGCSSPKQAVNFKIHTEPEGAHVIYRQDNSSWIYLGPTPLSVVEVIPEEQLDGNHTISIRAMRCGYLDQTKEWSGDLVVREIEEKGVIFWAPRLIKNNE